MADQRSVAPVSVRSSDDPRRVEAVAKVFREGRVHCDADWTTLAEEALDAADAVHVELRDALDDAIRRAYCQPLIPPVEGEDPEEVCALEQARVVGSPARMRHLASIQAAAWAVVDAWRTNG